MSLIEGEETEPRVAQYNDKQYDGIRKKRQKGSAAHNLHKT